MTIHPQTYIGLENPPYQSTRVYTPKQLKDYLEHEHPEIFLRNRKREIADIKKAVAHIVLKNKDRFYSVYINSYAKMVNADHSTVIYQLKVVENWFTTKGYDAELKTYFDIEAKFNAAFPHEK